VGGAEREAGSGVAAPASRGEMRGVIYRPKKNWPLDGRDRHALWNNSAPRDCRVTPRYDDFVMDEDLKKLIESTAAETRRQFEMIAERFDGMDKSFAAIDERFNTVDARFNTVDARFNAIDERFNAVDERFNAVDERFNAVDERFNAVDERFLRVDTTLAGLNQRFEGMDNAFAAMEERSNVDHPLAAIDTRFNGIDNAIVETRRHFELIAENLDSKIGAVAEMLVGRIDSVDAKVDALASEMASEFADVRSMFQFSHHELDQRVRVLEENVSKR
jgi:archaellum component FlaC